MDLSDYTRPGVDLDAPWWNRELAQSMRDETASAIKHVEAELALMRANVERFDNYLKG